MSLEAIRDLVDTRLDIVSHDMNRAMRFLAALTSIVAIPSVIGAFLGMNLDGIPWSIEFWQVAVASTLIAALMTVFFYKKGWLRSV